MKKLVAIGVLGIMVLASVPAPAHAGGAANAALALGAFAVFSTLFLAPVWATPPPVVYAPPPVVVYAPPRYYAPPAYAPQSYAPPAYSAAPPPIQREVVYPHGRYVLYGDGLTTAFQWVWVPNPPPPPPPAGQAPPPPR